MWAPDSIKASINSGDLGNRATYLHFRAAVMNLINGTIVFSGLGLPTASNDPMQVDAVKGKGKDKGKSKDKGKYKGASKVKGK
jgi:hypothetical protein